MAEAKNDGVFTGSDYSLKSLILITSDAKTVELTKMYISLNLYEDLFTPYVTGDMVIGDALDLINTYSIHGNEYVYMELDKPSLDEPIKKFFRIYKIDNRTYETQALQNYTIHFCSEELLLSSQKLIRKSYRGMTIDNMIKDILNTQLMVDAGKMKGLFTPTTGVYDLIIPRMQPLEAAMWLTTRAYSNDQSLFFFYENRDGYNFVSYETLIKQPVYAKYTRSPKVVGDASKNQHSINSIIFPADFDAIKTNRYGGYAATIQTFDMVNRNFSATGFNAQQFNDNIRPNRAMNLNKNRFGMSVYDAYDSMVKFHPTTDSDSSRNPLQPQNWLIQTAARMASLHDLKLVVNVPSDFLLKAGMLIELILPKMEIQDSNFSTERLKSGVYMIRSLHHGFYADASTTSMELISDGFTEALPAAVDFSGDLQDVKKK